MEATFGGVRPHKATYSIFNFVPIYLFKAPAKSGNERFPGTNLFAVPIILLALRKSGNAWPVPGLFIVIVVGSSQVSEGLINAYE